MSSTDTVPTSEVSAWLVNRRDTTTSTTPVPDD